MVEIALDKGVFVPLTVAEKVLHNVLVYLEYLKSKVEGQRSKLRLQCDVYVCVCPPPFFTCVIVSRRELI